MSDPNKSNYAKWYKQEFAMAQRVLGQHGTLEWATADYEAFRFKCEGVQLIFYPHQTKSTGNHNIRIRDSGSKNKELAQELMYMASIGAGNNNTFHSKFHNLNEEGNFARKNGINYGWAKS